MSDVPFQSLHVLPVLLHRFHFLTCTWRHHVCSSLVLLLQSLLFILLFLSQFFLSSFPCLLCLDAFSYSHSFLLFSFSLHSPLFLVCLPLIKGTLNLSFRMLRQIHPCFHSANCFLTSVTLFYVNYYLFLKSETKFFP